MAIRQDWLGGITSGLARWQYFRAAWVAILQGWPGGNTSGWLGGNTYGLAMWQYFRAG